MRHANVREAKVCNWMVTVYIGVTTLQRINTEISKKIFPEKELGGHSLKVHIHVSVSNLYIPYSLIDLPILLPIPDFDGFWL
jgi:hypothetical protein